MRRVLSSVAVSALLVLGAAGGAAASVEGPCGDEDGDGYVPGGVCVEAVAVEPFCDDQNFPALGYEVVLNEGSDPVTTIDVVWDNPSGPDVTNAGQPLVGSLPWPDAAWAEPDVRVVFGGVPVLVDKPECTGGAVLPDEQDGGATAADQTPRSGVAVLSATGSDVALLGLGALGAVALGAVAVTAARRGGFRKA